MRRCVFLRDLPRACRREMVSDGRPAVRARGGYARLRLRAEADLAPVLPDQGHRAARRSCRLYAVLSRTLRRPPQENRKSPWCPSSVDTITGGVNRVVARARAPRLARRGRNRGINVAISAAVRCPAQILLGPIAPSSRPE